MKKSFVLLISLIIISLLSCPAGQITSKTVDLSSMSYLASGPLRDFRDKYKEIEISELDKKQYQVSAYQSDEDTLPDIDIYLIPFYGNTQDYVEVEAGVFGSVFFNQSITVNSDGTGKKKLYFYISAERFDGEWFICSNILTQKTKDTIQEECVYSKTFPVMVGSTNMSVHVPFDYVKSDEGSDFDYVASRYDLKYPRKSAPLIARSIQLMRAVGKSFDAVIDELSHKYNMDFEYVTISGREFCVLYNKNAQVNSNGEFNKVYLIKDGKGVSGVRFAYNELPCGFDNAVMNTFGF